MSNLTASEASSQAESSGRNVTLALVSGSHGLNHAYVSLMPFIWTRMMVEIGLTYGQLGIMIGLTNIVSGVIQLWFGSISRVFRRKDLLGIGNILEGITTGVTGAAGSFSQVLGLWLANKIGGAPQHPCGNSIIAEQFEKKQRGRALGLNNAVAQVGMVVSPLITAFLIVRFDWRWTLVIWSLPAIIIGIMILAMIKEKPKEVGRRLKISDLGISPQGVKSYFKDRNILSITGAQLLAAGGRGIGVILTYVPLFLIQQLKYGTIDSGLLVTCLTAASVIGSFAFGALSDRFGRKRVMFFTYGISTISVVTFAMQTEQSFLVPVILFIMGLFIYAENPILQSWMSDITDEKNRDLNFGIYFTIGNGAGAIWGPIIGWLVQDRGFSFAFIVMAASYIAGALCLLFAKESAAI